jgi:SAM-dependent methyltransferase
MRRSDRTSVRSVSPEPIESTAGAVRTLHDSQLEAFDTEYVTPDLWPLFADHVRRDFPSGRFRLADLGGGNGVFADRVLGAFPESEAVVVDNAEVLLERNRPHPRKRLVLASITDRGLLEREQFDLVCFNWVLHHLVADGHSGSRGFARDALVAAGRMLAPGGRISVFENLYDGLVLDRLPGWLIYRMTASSRLARFASGQGANTAGVGVCFQSRASWLATFAESGAEVLDTGDGLDWEVSLRWRLLLHVGHLRCGHFWAKAPLSDAPAAAAPGVRPSAAA